LAATNGRKHAPLDERGVDGVLAHARRRFDGAAAPVSTTGTQRLGAAHATAPRSR